MRPFHGIVLIGLSAAVALAGCAQEPGSGIVTSSVAPPQTIAAKPAVDPACTTLSAQITAARQEGTPAKVHAVATGKTKTVRLKRDAIAKVAELDRLNSEFQMKCSKVPVQQTATLPQHTTPTLPATSTRQADATIAKAKAAQQAATAKATPIVAVPKAR